MPKKPSLKNSTTKKENNEWSFHVKFWSENLRLSLIELENKWESEGILNSNKKEYLRKKRLQVYNPPKFIFNWIPRKDARNDIKCPIEKIIKKRKK